jgi:hypothetical protein
MANTVYMSKTGLIGGEATKLDSIDGAVLVDNDAAFVNVSNVQYIYRLDADSGAVESSPNIIAPDTNPGTKRWILQGLNGASLNMPGLSASLPVFTDGSKNLVSNTMTGTGKVVMDTSPTISAPTISGHPVIEGVTPTGATGTGKLVFATSPTLVTPTIGAASGTSLTLSGLTASLPVFSDGSKALVSKSVADTLTALGVGAWTDYSASTTVAGFSGTPTKAVYYSVVNKIVYVSFFLSGTSNDNILTFTVPIAAAVVRSFMFFAYDTHYDPPQNWGFGDISASSTTVTLNYQASSWGGGGTDKSARGQFFYPIA